ncbi:HlyD family secretion protein [Occallatibacter savannae]|uniref:HlyD family secretion protein n=1 Tax=Occallatibacter savannae TaxID=1002691 RepID=UPI000D68BDF8|nr:efflux RND transporter periplasmic adaptor subunit [Occallatibacter savannae]
MRRRIAIAVGAAAVVLAVVWAVSAWMARRDRFEFSGTVETREIQIGSKVGGRVTEVAVEEGQLVKAGATLVRFECDELKAQRAQATAAMDQAQADVNKMLRGNRPEEIAQAEATARAQRAVFEEARNGPRRQEIEQAQADYKAASADATNAQVFYQRMEKLIAADTISRQQFDDARDKRDGAEQRAESMRQRLAMLQAGTRAEDVNAAEAKFKQADAAAQLARRGFRKEDVDAARGRLAEAQGRVAELDARLREAELSAPADAVVEVVSVRPGDLVQAGRIVITMLEASQLWVKVYVPETDLAHVRVGQRATVQVDSFSGHAFEGHVGQIASQAEFLPRNVQTKSDREHQVFGVKVYVDNAQGVLKSGMSARVRLE